MEELSAKELNIMKNRPDVPNLVKLQSRKAVEQENEGLSTCEKLKDAEPEWMQEIWKEKVRIFTQEELSEEFKNYLKASYPPEQYWREDLLSLL